MKITVLNAGLRVPSSTRLLADQIGAALRIRLADADQGTLDLRMVDLREHAHAITDAMLTGFATGELRDVLDDVATSDALVVVTPTFQGSYSGLFKSFMDVVDATSLRGVPVLLAATGGSERHSLMLDHAMRPLFSYLGAEPLPTGIFAATNDFGGEGSAALGERVERAASELAARVGHGVPGSGRPERAPRTPEDPFANVVPFTEMLSRYTR